MLVLNGITSANGMTQIVSITSKGQATIPKELRDKFGMTDKALVMETKDGILFKPLPSPDTEMGSLKDLFGDSTVKALLEEARAHERAK